VAARAARADCRASRQGSGHGRLVQRSRDDRCEHFPRGRLRQAPQLQLGESGQLLELARVRSANSMTTDSATSRRATKASTCAEERSSHWTSSTRQTIGCSSAASDSRPNSASPTRNRSGCAPVLRPNAVATASRCGAGNRSRRPGARHQLMKAGERKLHLPFRPMARSTRSPERARRRTSAARTCRFRARRGHQHCASPQPRFPPGAPRASRTRVHDRSAPNPRAGVRDVHPTASIRG
jgi:hypothetical protein